MYDPGWIRRRNSGNYASAAWGVVGPLLAFDAATITDTSSAGTVATAVGYSIGVPTIAASAATTFTVAATLSIEGPPAAGTNVTLSAAHNVWLRGTIGSLAFGTTTPGNISGTLGAITVTASGTNQNITLTPSGTGMVSIGTGGTGDVHFTSAADHVIYNTSANDRALSLTGGGNPALNAGGWLTLRGSAHTTRGGWVEIQGQTIASANVPIALGPNGGNILIGLTADGTGRLQFPVNTVQAGGITLGTKTIFESSASKLSLAAGGTHRLNFDGLNTTSPSLQSEATGAALTFAPTLITLGTSTAGHTMVLQTGAGTTALTLDASQDALFAPTNRVRITGTKVLSFGATSNATIGVSADTTSGILTVTPPSVSGDVRLAGTGELYLNVNNVNLPGMYSGAARTGLSVILDASIGGLGFEVATTRQFNLLSNTFRALGTRTVSFGNTALATIGVSADTTAGSVDLTLPSVSANGFRVISAASTPIVELVRNTTLVGLWESDSATNVRFGAFPASSTLQLLTAGAVSATLSGGASATLTGGAGNMIIVAGTGNSRTMTLQSTTSGGVATTFLSADNVQAVTLPSLAGAGSRTVVADANGKLSAP